MEQKTIILEENVTKNIDLTNVEKVPVLVLRGKVLFPGTIAGLDVGRERSIKAVDYALKHGLPLMIVTQKDVQKEVPAEEDVYKTGVISIVAQIAKLATKMQKVNVRGLFRAQIVGYEKGDDFDFVTFEKKDFLPSDEIDTQAALSLAKESFAQFIVLDKKTSANKDVFDAILNITDANEFVNNAASVAQFKYPDSQTLMEEDDTYSRLVAFYGLIQKEIEVAKIERKINATVKKSIDKNQKEYLLREQIKAIHDELGDDADAGEKLADKIKAKGMPKESEEKVLKEIKKLDKLSPNMPEYTILLNYVDQILDLPFSEKSVDTEDINKAKEILDEDHFGLQKVKERILEYLSVIKLTGKIKGPILCFVGPPGVGKTSIAKSIARALDRKFVRMSLGGVRDESEIRGHRRTYVAAMPGRIIYAMQRSNTVNPVFLLDEIDKIGKDIQGDPASALLEVLDPEQNNSFRDRYLEIPYDLSEVMFITTANTLESIPAPLLDRMEVIEIGSYTEEEKVCIADRYLAPKQIAENGIDKDRIEFTEDGIKKVIENYTSEAGVRNLEREISAICRKVATKIACGEFTDKIVVTKENVPEFLGPEKIDKDDYKREDAVGVTTGLAWTQVGGVTLNIEVALMKGKGDIQLTGKLGEVMKESARIALSFIKSHAETYGIDADRFENTDVHIHVPEGATPKDGPSAGVTLATSILSAFTNKKVSGKVAMTGEITLTGRVLPIGGLKEKALAAYRAGINNVIIPKGNQKDVSDIPEEIRGKIKFAPVSRIDEVFKKAIKEL
mgnify:CR=1 FL=1